ncbi:MAG: DinB family protein [Terracidiphilus sp.]
MPVAPELVTTAHIYKRNEVMLAKAIDGLSGEQWTQRPQETSNSALWILGHIVWARSMALKFLGVSWSAPWLTHFERGSKPEDASQYPSSDEVLAAWKELSASMPPALEAVPAEAMAAATSSQSPSLDGTVGGMVSFLAMHETYHVGQVVYLRRLLGHERIVG